MSLTGVDTFTLDPFADGMSSISSGAIGTVTMPSYNNTIVRNLSFNNKGHGLSLNALTTGNRVDNNQVYGNGGSGVLVAGGATNNVLTKNQGNGNALYDGEDANAGCDNNAGWATSSLPSTSHAWLEKAAELLRSV